MPSSTSVRLAKIRKRLDLVRGSMLQASPDSLEELLPGLAEACDELATLSQEISAHPPSAGPEREKILQDVRRLRVDLARVATLTVQGFEFCRKWSNVLQSAAGYLPNGEVAQIGPTSSIVVEG